MIRFITDYTTKALPPEHFSDGQEVSRSDESELYFVRLGVAGYLVAGKLVDQDFREIVLAPKVAVVSGDRRFADTGRGGEILGLDAPQRASTGPGNAALFGDSVDPGLHSIELDQLRADLAASTDLFTEHRDSAAAEIARLTQELSEANAEGDEAVVREGDLRRQVEVLTTERDAAVAQAATLTNDCDALAAERDGLLKRNAELDVQLAAATTPSATKSK